jgi:hypothetical protein
VAEVAAAALQQVAFFDQLRQAVAFAACRRPGAVQPSLPEGLAVFGLKAC